VATQATQATLAGDMAMVSYLCGERGVSANYVPGDEIIFATLNSHEHTPLLVAMTKGDEDMALYLLSLPLPPGKTCWDDDLSDSGR